MKRSIYILTIILITGSSFAAKKEIPKNIILMIGDGMGTPHLTAALITKGTLNIERMTTGGLIKTFAANNIVTDSAASGTAMATGEKTNNGVISMTPDRKPIKTLFEYAEEKGISTGIAVTCNVTHATPAAFSAHVKNRKMSDEIAEQMSKANMKVIFGGGLGSFTPKGTPGGQRKDKKNLLTPLKEKGMQIATNEEDFAKISNKKPAIALLASGHPEYADKRKISLSDMTSKALEILDYKNKKGFILVVEGSQIDWAGHKNNAKLIIQETIDFDDAIGVALNFSEKDKKTLVIVTADHETGGMSLLDGSLEKKSVSKTNFSTKGHSAEMTPLFSSGPGSKDFGGIKDNTYIGKTLIDYVRK